MTTHRSVQLWCHNCVQLTALSSFVLFSTLVPFQSNKLLHKADIEMSICKTILRKALIYHIVLKSEQFIKCSKIREFSWTHKLNFCGKPETVRKAKISELIAASFIFLQLSSAKLEVIYYHLSFINFILLYFSIVPCYQSMKVKKCFLWYLSKESKVGTVYFESKIFHI
jgi:hypothetical protein